MSISGVNGTNSSAPAGFGVPNSLSAESLLTYCQSQLGDIDDELSSYLDQQKKLVGQKQVLSELKTTLAKYQPPNTTEKKLAVAEAYGKAATQLAELGDTELLAQVESSFKYLFPDGDIATAQTVYGAWSAGVGGMSTDSAAADKQLKDLFGSWEGPVTKEGWNNTVVSELTNSIEGISGNAEMNMLQLQSLMAKRQTAVQLTTNILAKYDQTLGTIVNNLK